MLQRMAIGCALAALAAAQESRVSVQIRPIWAPILTPELRNSERIEAGQYIFYDPEVSDYVLRYLPTAPNGGGPAKLIRLGYSNQASATAETSITGLADGSARNQYQWRFTNRPQSSAPIRGFFFAIPRSDRDLSCKSEQWGKVQLQQSESGSPARHRGDDGPRMTLSLGDFRFLMWTGTSPAHLSPGSNTGALSCTSTYFPGWVTVYLPAGVQPPIPDDVPQEALDQLGKTLKIEHYWNTTHVLWPKYPVDAPVEIIAMDFLAGMSVAPLDAKSEFVAAVNAQLRRITEAAAATLAIEAKPTTNQEREILAALKLSLPKHFR